MRALITAILISFSAAQAVAPYWSVSRGPGRTSGDADAVVDRYSILHLVATAGGTFENKREPVEVKGDFRSSVRWALGTGILVGERYRVEGELLIEKGNVVLVHHGPTHARAENSPKVRRAGACMLNAGGDLCSLGRITPYSLVGVGYIVSHLEGKDVEIRGAYQWVTGLELSWKFPWALYVQHRLHKPLRCEGTHSYEVGVRLKG